ncbi:AAA family ATPase [Comamonas badia]|uniref:AAA family ATPase n=1 Tax=Comamonas badia TaxID=265291 RepID=UPI00040B805B|nr:AAA family ATPase [Comamonas badia]
MSGQAAEPAAVAAAQPLRIKRLTLTDFRAFPGTEHFDLDGKNLLVYGENGAGKSSIFHALNGFFALKPVRALREHKNVFSGKPDGECKVAVEYSNGDAPVEWTVAKHPCVNTRRRPAGDWYQYLFGNADSRTISTALRSSCLDYRALLDTNYRQGSGPINLFAIAVEHLLRDYSVTVSGGSTSTLGNLWGAVLAGMPSSHTSAALARINQACVDFNTAFRGAFPALVPLINELMQLLGWQDVELKGFNTPGLTYNQVRLKQNRAVDGQQLMPELSFRNHALPTPQLFLNEARLSALALAIYLAGRLACTPTAEATALKLLVLDDVLIGLDNSNRTPVLEVLMHKFADWQVVLLTHDRNWFDLARNHLPHEDWRCYEVYEGDRQAQAPMPIVYQTANRPAQGLLKKARELLETQYVEAAANYTRQAFELGARKACEIKKIEMRYCVDPKTHQAQDFLDKLKSWPGSRAVTKKEWDAVIKRLEMAKTVVLNPYSHALAPNIPKREVEAAIDAVNGFLDLVARRRQ